MSPCRNLCRCRLLHCLSILYYWQFRKHLYFILQFHCCRISTVRKVSIISLIIRMCLAYTASHFGRFSLCSHDSPISLPAARYYCSAHVSRTLVSVIFSYACDSIECVACWAIPQADQVIWVIFSSWSIVRHWKYVKKNVAWSLVSAFHILWQGQLRNV